MTQHLQILVIFELAQLLPLITQNFVSKICSFCGSNIAKDVIFFSSSSEGLVILHLVGQLGVGWRGGGRSESQAKRYMNGKGSLLVNLKTL